MADIELSPDELEMLRQLREVKASQEKQKEFRSKNQFDEQFGGLFRAFPRLYHQINAATKAIQGYDEAALEELRKASEAQTQYEKPNSYWTRDEPKSFEERIESALAKSESPSPAPKAEAPAPKAEAPAPKAEAPAPKAEAPAPEAAPKAEAPAPKAEAEKPTIRKSDARFLDRLDERVLEDFREEPVEAKPVAAPEAAPEAKPVAEDSDYDPTKHEMYGSGPEAEEPAPPKAVRVSPEELEEDYGQEAISLFKNTHGTEFDPKSSADKKKLEKMKSMLAKQGGLGNMSPNQFALQVYRNS